MNQIDNKAITKQLLNKFQEGYIKRDSALVDFYMDQLFVKSTEPVVLGTSSSELCLGNEAVKDLLKSDWEYWGDVRFDIDNTLSQPLGENIFFAVHGTLKCTFKSGDSSFERYVPFVQNNLKDAEMGTMEKLTLINWGLNHFLFPRQPEERSYGWPLRLTGLIVQENGLWKFKYMQFSLPCSVYPDERIGTEFLDNLYSNTPMDSSSIAKSRYASEIKNIVGQFLEKLHNNDIDNAVKYFVQNRDTLIVGPKESWYIGIESIREGFKTIHEKWGQMHLELDNALVLDAAATVSIVCEGRMVSTVDINDELLSRIKDIENILSSEMSAKEKLFYAHRNIGAVLKEAISGNERIFPCRFEAHLAYSGTSWLICAMQLSFPHSWILEGKYETEQL